MSSAAQLAIDHAALSGHFAPKRFLYAAGDQVEQVLRELGPLCHEVVQDDKILWRMRNADRLRVLKQLMGDKTHLNHLLRKRGPKSDDTFAQVLKVCLKGTTVPKIISFIPRNDPDALGNLREAISATLTAQSVVSAKRRTQLETFRQKLQHASIKHANLARKKMVLPSKLCGRFAERKAVIGFLSDQPIQAPITVLDPAKPSPPRSLLILGSPGMGKSAFLADLSPRIRALASKPWVLRFDFDQMTLLHGGTIAWTEEATRQLGHQIPSKDQQLSHLRRELAQRRAEDSTEESLSAVEFLFEDAITALADITPRPMVVLLDTIEEIVARNMREDFERNPDATLFRTLIDWVERLGRLNGAQSVHVIYSGRVPPPIAPALLPDWFDSQLELPELADPAAAELLGLFDPNMPKSTRTALVQGLGGHPLHLILVQKHLKNLDKNERLDVIRDLQEGGLRGLKSSTVMQTLYIRFLDRLRIKDQSHGLTENMIKKLAHPGLLLREITQDSLANVIAPAVGVTFSGPQAVEQAFAILRDQVWLVNSAPGSDIITHRPDVRRVMLPMMLGSTAPEIRAVLTAAVDDRDQAGDAVNAGYFRSLLGETDWLINNPDLAQDVVNKTGHEELELLAPNVRAALKYFTDRGGELSEVELRALPEDLQDLAQISSSAQMVRKTGARSSASAVKRQANTEPDNQSRYADEGLIDRLKQNVQSVAESGDAYAVLNHQNLQSEIETAFVEADFETVCDLGWSALSHVKNWPNLDRALNVDKPFHEHWLWLLTLASTVIKDSSWRDISLFRTMDERQHSIMFSLKRLDFSAGIFDFDMLHRTLVPNEGAFQIDPADVNFDRMQLESDLGFRGHRLLGQSNLARSIVGGNEVTIAASAITQSFLAPEFKQFAQLKDLNSSLQMDYQSSKSRAAQLVSDIFDYWDNPKSVTQRDESRIYQDYIRLRRIDAAQSFRISFAPLSKIDAIPATLDRIARGQTPELHETLAGLLVNEIQEGQVADIMLGIIKRATFWPTDAEKRFELLVNPDENTRTRHDAAVELVRFIDLCGLLTPLAENMAEVSSSHRVNNVARLLRRLDQLWTWPVPSV